MRTHLPRTITLPPAVLARARAWAAAAPRDGRGRPLERRTFSGYIRRACELADGNAREIRHGVREHLQSIVLHAEHLRRTVAAADATDSIDAIRRAAWAARLKLAHPDDRATVQREMREK